MDGKVGTTRVRVPRSNLQGDPQSLGGWQVVSGLLTLCGTLQAVQMRMV